jgi:hypothetical protein
LCLGGKEIMEKTPFYGILGRISDLHRRCRGRWGCIFVVRSTTAPFCSGRFGGGINKTRKSIFGLHEIKKGVEAAPDYFLVTGSESERCDDAFVASLFLGDNLLLTRRINI